MTTVGVNLMEQIASIVSTEVLKIAQRKIPALAAVEPQQHLIDDLRLDSLDIAELVAVLEMALHRDPFASSLSISDCPTVGKLSEAYSSCA